MTAPRILVAGGGYAGMHAARRLQSKLRRGEVSVTVVDPRSYMTYQPFLSDAAAGSVEPRHVVAPLRQVLSGCRVLTGSVTAVQTERRTATVTVSPHHDEELSYDYLIVAPGSVSKILPVPGLAEQAIGFTTLGEAIYLRNHVLTQLDKATTSGDAALRRRLLTFVFVGGGYAGVEALGQLEEMARFAVRHYYRDLREHDMRWVLVEAADRIMPEVSRQLADRAADVLRARGIDVRMQTTTDSVVDGHVHLDDGSEFDANTIVWTTGVAPHPMLDGTDLPRDDRGRVRCRATLEVEDRPGVFAAGDGAAVPDLSAGTPDAMCVPSAQHATRQGKHLADNIVATLRGRPMDDYEHAFAGSVAALGRRNGVAEIYGRSITGWPAWVVHRAYHLTQMPTVNRRVRIAADWTLDLLFPRQVVALGELHEPAAEFAEQVQQ